MNTIKDAHAFKQGQVYAHEIDEYIWPDGSNLPMNEALHCAARSGEILFSDPYDRGRFVAGVRRYYKDKNEHAL